MLPAFETKLVPYITIIKKKQEAEKEKKDAVIMACGHQNLVAPKWSRVIETVMWKKGEKRSALNIFHNE